jgi:hypothetical protein
LLRIEYDTRYQESLQVDIKCAATNLIVHLFNQQSLFLQEDFSRRVIQQYALMHQELALAA